MMSGNRPDELGKVAVLLYGAVDGKPDAALLRMPDLGGAMDRRARRGAVEAFAEIPGAAHILRLLLQIAPREIEPAAIAEDEIERLVARDVPARPSPSATTISIS